MDTRSPFIGYNGEGMRGGAARGKRRGGSRSPSKVATVPAPHPSNRTQGAVQLVTGESDAKLAAKSLQGNEKAFRLLVERHQPMVYAVVRGVLGDREDVDDVVQDTFIKIYRGLAGFRGDAQFSSWAYRIARNEAINAARRVRISGVPVEETELAAPQVVRPDVDYERRDERITLDRYLAQLDEEYRVALELRYMGEKSYAEISELMGLPVGTVKSYIHRAKIELKRIMTKRTPDGARKDLT